MKIDELVEGIMSEISRGDYHKKATMGKAMAQMSAGFARSPEEREKHLAIAARREKGLERSKARTDKFWAEKNAKDEAERLAQTRAKYAGVDIDAEIAKLQPAIKRAYHEYQYGARNTYSQGKSDYDSLMAKVHELERAKKALGESATAGATSAANVSVGPAYKNKPAKTPKNKDGTAKNALDTGANLITGGSIKR